jgi:hypothetical protein
MGMQHLLSSTRIRCYKIWFTLFVYITSFLSLWFLLLRRPNSSDEFKHLGSIEFPLRFTPEVYNLEEVPEGESRQFEFHYENISNHPIRDFRLIPACSCLMISPLPSTIPPGSKGFVRLRFSSTRKAGWQTKVVRARYNVAGQVFEKVLEVRASVRASPHLTAHPSIADFGCVELGQEPQVLLTIRQGDASSRRINVVSVDTPSWLTCDLSEVADGAWQLVIRLTNSDVAGPLTDTLSVHTDSEIHPVLCIPVTAKIPGNIAFTPESIVKVVTQESPGMVEVSGIDNLRRDRLHVDVAVDEIQGGSLNVSTVVHLLTDHRVQFHCAFIFPNTTGREVILGTLLVTTSRAGVVERTGLPFLFIHAE